MTNLQVIDASRTILKDVLSSGRTFPDNTSSFYTDSEMLDWLHWVQWDMQQVLIQTFENWFITSTSVSLVAGTSEYPMPTDAAGKPNSIKVLRLEDTDNPTNPLEIYPISFNDKEYFNSPLETIVTALGNVRSYAIKGNRFLVRPRPNVGGSIKVYYSRRISSFDSASSISEIPEEYHEGLVLGVIKRGLVKGEATAEALTFATSEYSRFKNRMKTTAEHRQVQRPRYVKRRKRRSY